MAKKVSKTNKTVSSDNREFNLMIRFNRQELEILEAVANDSGLDKSNTIRSLLLREYKKIQRDRANQINMFKE
jgi:hypothetical protein